MVIVLAFEPDSLPNRSSSRGDSHCSNSATVASCKTGIAYAVQRIAEVTPPVAMYLGAGHGGWLLEERHAGLCENRPGARRGAAPPRALVKRGGLRSGGESLT